MTKITSNLDWTFLPYNHECREVINHDCGCDCRKGLGLQASLSHKPSPLPIDPEAAAMFREEYGIDPEPFEHGRPSKFTFCVKQLGDGRIRVGCFQVPAFWMEIVINYRGSKIRVGDPSRLFATNLGLLTLLPDVKRTIYYHHFIYLMGQCEIEFSTMQIMAKALINGQITIEHAPMT